MKKNYLLASAILFLCLAATAKPNSDAPTVATRIAERPAGLTGAKPSDKFTTKDPGNVLEVDSRWSATNVAPGPENVRKSQAGQTEETRQVKALVKEAAALVKAKGEAAFPDLQKAGSKWRQGESYIFIVDTDGKMLVHADKSLIGKNQLGLKDQNGRPIIKGLLDAVQADPAKPEGWHHYQWPAPGETKPRWKSSYAQLVKAPSGKTYLVGSGIYTNRMEKEYVIDAVKNAVALLEKKGEAAFPLFRDPQGPFWFRDAYLLVIDMNGIELVNPAFPDYVGKKVLDLKDSQGKQFIREMLQTVEKNGSGWVNYAWPKPGETGASQKSTYISKAKLGDKWVVVGCGVYLDETPKGSTKPKKL